MAVSSGEIARIYSWTDGSGFGSATATTAALTGGVYGLAWNTARTAFAIGVASSSSSQRLSIFAFNNSTGALGTQYSNPPSNMSGRANHVKFFQADNVVVAADDASPYVAAYAWNNSTGFGTKFSNPSTLMSGSNNGGDINVANNTYIAANSGPNTFVNAYPISASAWGTKYANPATLPADNGNKARFTQNGTAAAYAHGASPYLSVYPFNAGFGTRYASAASPLDNTSPSVAFSADDKAILSGRTQVGAGSSPIHAWVWSASGFGTKYSNPASLTLDAAYDVKFNKVTYQ
jgi:hypothetical protein